MSEATRKMEEELKLLRAVTDDHERQLRYLREDVADIKERDGSLMWRLRWLVFGASK